MTDPAHGSTKQVRLRAPERRRQLLDAAERVVARDGAGASMSSIAAEAGVAKAILYRHFASKAELYLALAAQATESILADIRAALRGAGTTRRRTELAFDAYLRHIETHAVGYQLFTRTAQREALEAGQLIADFAERLGDELAGEIGADFGLTGHAELEALALTWAHALVGMVLGAANVWVLRRHVSRPELVEQLGDLIWGRYAELAAHLDRQGRPGTVQDTPPAAP